MATENRDTTAPAITLNGSATLNINQGAEYNDAGATASDNVDGDISANIVVTNTVNTNTVGQYSVSYNVSDAAGNTASEVVRTVTVLDVTPPVITLIGDATVTVNLGDAYSDAGANATDNVDGDLTSSLTVVNSVDVNTEGTYSVTYNVSDAAGNSATQVTRTVNVVAVLANPLNDTGITWGGNYPDGNNADCSGETIEQQDCSLGRDADAGLVKIGAGMAGFDFTKLDENGDVLADQTQAYDENGSSAAGTKWSCVKDNHTGLIWEVKTDTAQGADLHSKNDRYNWYNTDSATNGGADGYADDDGNICYGYVDADGDSNTDNPNNDPTNCNTQAFVARVNASNGGNGLCGATDWRIPSLNELQSIVHLGRVNPSIDHNYFPNTYEGFYLSSSPIADNNKVVWGKGFNLGYSALDSRNGSNRVRLVRISDVN